MTYKEIFYKATFQLNAIGLLIISMIHLPSGVFSEIDTSWEYQDCGQIIITEKANAYDGHKKAIVSYYVTYQSEFYNRAETVKVTPETYVNAISYQNNNQDICFTVQSDAKNAFTTIYILLTLSVITLVIFFITNIKLLFLHNLE